MKQSLNRIYLNRNKSQKKKWGAHIKWGAEQIPISLMCIILFGDLKKGTIFNTNGFGTPSQTNYQISGYYN